MFCAQNSIKMLTHTQAERQWPVNCHVAHTNTNRYTYTHTHTCTLNDNHSMHKAPLKVVPGIVWQTVTPTMVKRAKQYRNPLKSAFPAILLSAQRRKRFATKPVFVQVRECACVRVCVLVWVSLAWTNLALVYERANWKALVMLACCSTFPSDRKAIHFEICTCKHCQTGSGERTKRRTMA